MREQLDGENADPTEARRPHFEVLPRPMDSTANQPHAEVFLTRPVGSRCPRVVAHWPPWRLHKTASHLKSCTV